MRKAAREYKMATVDPWTMAKKALGSCLRLLPPYESFSVGDYVYDGSDSDLSFVVTRQKTQSRCVVTFYSAGSRKINHLTNISSHASGGYYKLHQEGIVYTSTEHTYPDFNYEWRDGRLFFLRVNLSGTSFANYYPATPGITMRKGEEAQQLPATLEGLTELLGRPIPFQINHAEAAQKILEESELIPFCEAVRRMRQSV